jgi:N-acyl-D-aspartate/D-glutamate deacylase
MENGSIFDGLGSAPTQCDIGIQNGKIVAIASSLTSNAHQVVDASGLWVTPGLIDIHTH